MLLLLSQWYSVWNTQKSIHSPIVLVTFTVFVQVGPAFFQRDVALKVEIPSWAKPRCAVERLLSAEGQIVGNTEKKPPKNIEWDESQPPALQKRSFKMEPNAASQHSQ